MSHIPVMLLHGAVGASTQFEPLLGFLKDKFEVHTLDFEGHGTSPLRNRPCRIEHFAENVLEYLNTHAIEATAVFGHSMGGLVGLYLARFFPVRVTAVFTLGTKFAWTKEIVEKENSHLIPEKIVAKVPRFADQLKARHSAAGWEKLLEKMREMQLYVAQHNALPDDDLRSIGQKVRISVGDRDKLVGIEESARIYRLLSNGEFQIFPNTPHPLEMASMRILAGSLTDFLKSS